MGEERFTDVFRACEQVGMANLPRGQCTAQTVDSVFVTNNVPAWLCCLLSCHEDMVAEMVGNGKDIQITLL
jgi:hypothetical protein